MMQPDTLRTYAAIFELERVDVDRFGRKPVKPTEIELAAAQALRFLAAAIDAGLVARGAQLHNRPTANEGEPTATTAGTSSSPRAS